MIPLRSAVVSVALALASGAAQASLTAADADPVAVAVGKGSYASEPPHPSRQLAEFLARGVHLDPSLPSGTPAPSNHWWSHALYSDEVGRLWAYPLAVGADRQGVLVWLPGLDAAHKDFRLGEPLAVHAVTGADAAATSIEVADFAAGSWPIGWTSTGDAWGDGAVAAALPGQMAIEGNQGAVADSIHGGDRATGTLSSAPFAIRHRFLHVQLGGGRDDQHLRCELVVGDHAVRSATGDNSEHLHWVDWDLASWQGGQARLRVVDDASGGWGHLLVGRIVLDDDARDPDRAAALFAPGSQTVLRWGDWTVTLRLHAGPASGEGAGAAAGAAAGDSRWLDLTTGRGIPFAWVEAHGLGLAIPGEPGDVLNALDGKPLPAADAAGVTGATVLRDGRLFAVYAIGGRLVAGPAGGLVPARGDAPTALAIAAIPAGVDPLTWMPAALAVPRDSVFAWNYDREAGRIDTTWTLRTDALGPGAGDPLQGWLPHHWRSAPVETAFVPGEFRTPRGRLRLQSGTTFHWSWRFPGLLPALPPPPADGPAPTFDPAREADYLTGFAAERLHGPAGRPKAAGDTYWGGKDVLLDMQTALIAQQLKNPGAPALVQAATELLADWFTWIPGKKEHYFARYPELGALVGFSPSYGSETFTDNHFHYGYFTMASAMAMVADPGFRADYGGMARLVAKQYANWDRNDHAFPFLRTFEPWCGHSYAGGSSSPDGNNQESSSEAMQSWAGLALLGAALGDRPMEDCGAMGYAIEGEAVKEYWNDYYAWKDGPQAANLPSGYGHPIVGIVGDSGNAFATFFNGQPRFIYGIQWLPLTPALQYLGFDPAFGKAQWDNLLREQRAIEPAFALEKLDGGWDHVALSYLMVNDPETTAATFEKLWQQHSPIATGMVYTPTTYYLLHAWRRLGTLAPDAWTDQPTACVYRRSDGHHTVAAWNPGTGPLTVTVQRGGGVLGRITVAPGAITCEDLRETP